MTARNFTFTCYHDLYAPVDWRSGSELRKTFSYVAFGLEHCPKTDRMHLQAWVRAWHPIRLNQARTAAASQWPRLSEFNKMKGSIICNDAYCSKENELQEYGVKPNDPGVKHTLLEFKRKIEDGESCTEIAENDKYFNTFCQYRGGLKDYEQHIDAKEQDARPKKVVKLCREMPEVYIRWGPPRSGKSKWAEDEYGVGKVYSMPKSYPKFFGNYRGQPVVLFDEFEAFKSPIEDALFYFDRYPRDAEIKGGYTKFKPLTIILTSNINPRDWWPTAEPNHWTAFVERVVSCKKIYKHEGQTVEEDDPLNA